MISLKKPTRGRAPRLRRRIDWGPLEGLPRSVTRSVVLHEVAVEDGRPVWRATAYVLNRRNEFVPAPSRGTPLPDVEAELRL